MGNSIFYQWRDQYGVKEISDSKRLEQREAENRKLKQVLTELGLKAQLQK